MRRCLAAVCCLLGVSASISAVQLTLDRRAIEEATFLGQSRNDTERNRFHNQYRLGVSRAPVDWIDVITPYHRVVLAAEARARVGNRVFGQREAQAALSGAPDPIELLVELTFHPLNAYVGVPIYDITLQAAQNVRVQPRHIVSFPRFGPRTESPAPFLPVPDATPVLGNGQPMLGGVLLVQFNANDMNPNGRYEVVMAEAGKELVRVGLDLGKLR